MAVDPEEVHSFLTDRRESGPEELEHYFIQFEDYWERKLWHELTDVLIEYFKHPASAPERIRVYHGFVKIFASKINQLKLVTIGLRAASQYKSKARALAPRGRCRD